MSALHDTHTTNPTREGNAMTELRTTDDRSIEYDDGLIDIQGEPHMRDAKGRLVPLDLVRPEEKIEDEMVRKVIAFATDLRDQIARFRGHTFEDIGAYMALIEGEYGVTKGGRKGNVTFQTYDGLRQVRVQVADLLEFGPQLQVAKQLLDECLNEWAAESRPELRAIVTRAFNTDKEGQVNRAELFTLLRLDIDDERWSRAMEAIKDGIRVVGSREYVRFYERDRQDGPWRAVTIDLAKAA